MSRSKQSISSWMKQRVRELSGSPRASKTPQRKSRSRQTKSKSKSRSPTRTRTQVKTRSQSRRKVVVEDDDDYKQTPKTKTRTKTRVRTRRTEEPHEERRLRLYQAPLQFEYQPSRLSQRLSLRRSPIINEPEDIDDSESTSESDDDIHSLRRSNQPQRRFVQQYRQVPCNAKDDKIYCGSKCYLPNNTYARFGTPFECMLKGMGIGMYRERERNRI